MDELPAPSRAESARTLVARADSVTLTWAGRTRHLHDGVGADASGRPVLVLGDDGPAGAQAPVVLDFTEVAALALRDRVRARLTMVGCATRSDGAPGTWTVAAERIFLRAGRTAAFLDAAAYAAAAPDPLAAWQDELVRHLGQDHIEVVTALCRLLPARELQGVLRVLPSGLDRYGVTLRVERLHGASDVRVAFAAPLAHPQELAAAMGALLVAARPCPRRRAQPS